MGLNTRMPLSVPVQQDKAKNLQLKTFYNDLKL